MMIIIMMIIGYCNKTNFSSSINGVIRPVLNFLFFFFYDNISQLQKINKKHNQYIVFFFQDKILSTLNTLVFVQDKILYQMSP